MFNYTEHHPSFAAPADVFVQTVQTGAMGNKSPVPKDFGLMASLTYEHLGCMELHGEFAGRFWGVFFASNLRGIGNNWLVVTGTW